MFDIKVQKIHPDATFSKTYPTDIGYDLTCTGIRKITGSQYVPDLYHLLLGVKVAPPPHTFFMLAPRSSFGQSGWFIPNSIGIIDPEYRGEWIMQIAPLAGTTRSPYDFVGRRVAQAILLPDPTALAILLPDLAATSRSFSPLEKDPVELVDILPSTKRGSGGFGSTGV